MNNDELSTRDYVDAILTCHFSASGVQIDPIGSSSLSSREMQELVLKNMNKVSELMSNPICEDYEEILDMSRRLAEAKEALNVSLDECVERGIVPLSLSSAGLS